MRTFILVIATLAFSASTAFAMTCDQVRAKAKAPQNKPDAKPGCTLQDHYLGTGNGSTVSIYKCGGTTYKLETDQFGKCGVNGGKRK
ncbi:MAG: hypothetical protein JST80_01740 [Bdellovibrionales bacterium]|nr:hypothetical protein [Bdellovibrionales bacterium]